MLVGKVIYTRLFILLTRRYHFPIAIEKRIFIPIPKYLHQILKIRLGTITQAAFPECAHRIQGITIPIINDMAPGDQILTKVKPRSIIATWGLTCRFYILWWHLKKQQNNVVCRDY